MSIWDDPRLQRPWIKFDQPGTKVIGEILRLDIRTVQAGANQPMDCPWLELRLQDGTTKELTATQTELATKLAAERPAVGDWVAITYQGERQLGGGKAAKLFDVAIKRGTPPADPFAGLQGNVPPEPRQPSGGPFAGAQGPFSTTHEEQWGSVPQTAPAAPDPFAP